MPLATASSSAPSSSASLAAARSESRSNSAPAVAASSSRSPSPGRSAGEPPADDLAHALRRAELVQRTAEPERAVDDSTMSVSTSARHSSQTRNALPAVRSLIARASSGTPSVRRPRRAARTRSPRRPTARRGAAARRRRSGAGRRASRPARPAFCLGVAERRQQQQPRPPLARARWRSRPSVGASAQCASSSTSSTGRRRLTPSSRSVTAVCSRWRSVSGSARPASAGRPRASPRSGSSRASSPPVGRARRAARRGRVTRASCSSASTNGPYGGVHDRVAGAVEDERAAVGGLGRELAHEPALARAGLAADEHHPAPVAARPTGQRAQHRQLALAPDEREGGGQAQRAGESAQRSRSTIVRSDHRAPASKSGHAESGSGRVMTGAAAAP